MLSGADCDGMLCDLWGLAVLLFQMLFGCKYLVLIDGLNLKSVSCPHWFICSAYYLDVLSLFIVLKSRRSLLTRCLGFTACCSLKTAEMLQTHHALRLLVAGVPLVSGCDCAAYDVLCSSGVDALLKFMKIQPPSVSVDAKGVFIARVFWQMTACLVFTVALLCFAFRSSVAHVCARRCCSTSNR